MKMCIWIQDKMEEFKFLIFVKIYNEMQNIIGSAKYSKLLSNCGTKEKVVLWIQKKKGQTLTRNTFI